jgi:hypothetical protein
MDTKIIDKVVKLLALADGTNHVEEANTARNMAAELMAKYNISVQDTLVASDPFVKERDDKGKIRQYSFDVALVARIARFNGVFMLTSLRNRKGAYIYVGRPSDVASHKYMVAIILEQRAAAWKRYVAAGGQDTISAWSNGFALGLSNKLYAIEKARDSKLQEWGLVPVDPRQQAEAWYKKDHSVGTCRSSIRAYSRDGAVAGRSVNINRGVEKQGAVLRIKSR